MGSVWVLPLAGPIKWSRTSVTIWLVFQNPVTLCWSLIIELLMWSSHEDTKTARMCRIFVCFIPLHLEALKILVIFVISFFVVATHIQMFLTCPALVEAASNQPSLPVHCSTVLSQLHHHGYKFHYINVLLVMPLVTVLELSSTSGELQVSEIDSALDLVCTQIQFL